MNTFYLLLRLSPSSAFMRVWLSPSVFDIQPSCPCFSLFPYDGKYNYCTRRGRSLKSSTADATHSSAEKADIPIAIQSTRCLGFMVRSGQCTMDGLEIHRSQRTKETRSNLGLHRPSRVKSTTPSTREYCAPVPRAGTSATSSAPLLATPSDALSRLLPTVAALVSVCIVLIRAVQIP